MHLVPLLLYAAATAAYVAHFAWRDPRVGRLATALLGGGVLTHTFLIGMQTMQAGHAPLVGTSAAISAFVWLLGLAYLYIELSTDDPARAVAFYARVFGWKIEASEMPGGGTYYMFRNSNGGGGIAAKMHKEQPTAWMPYVTVESVKAAQKAGPNLTTDSFIKAMDTMTFEPDMFGSARATFSATKRLGSELSRLSQIQNGKWVVVSDYVK